MFVLIAGALIAITAALVRSIKRSLADRPQARRLRANFTAIANDLVTKPEFPEEHARQLVMLSAIRSGWLTRTIVLMIVRRALRGGTRPSAGVPKLQAVPEELRARYVEALLSLMLADSYYSLFMGSIWRAANSWVFSALESIKPDVNAHATQVVIKQAWMAPNHAPHVRSDLPSLCHV